MPRHNTPLTTGLRGLRARRSLGQNFLVDTGIRDTIIDAAQLHPSDLVIEVGPGAGVLTEGLASRAGKVIAIELDASLVAKLKGKLSRFNNLEIVHADILKLKLEDMLKGASGYKVIANIPYYITSPILHFFAHAVNQPSLMVIMLQKEVAADVVAVAGRMRYLAVAMQLYYSVEPVCRVPAASFYPPPKVDSAVVRFSLLPAPAIAIDDRDKFLAAVHAGFAAPRKQLRNSLAIGLKLDTSAAVEMLRQADIDPARRAETLTLQEWETLYNMVKKEKVSGL